jgi:hypothetical protein
MQAAASTAGQALPGCCTPASANHVGTLQTTAASTHWHAHRVDVCLLVLPLMPCTALLMLHSLSVITSCMLALASRATLVLCCCLQEHRLEHVQDRGGGRCGRPEIRANGERRAALKQSSVAPNHNQQHKQQPYDVLLVGVQ